MSEGVTIQDFQPDPHNANRGSVRGVAFTERSIRKYGFARPPVADAKRRILAGNKAFQAGVELGLPVREIVTDGREMIVVRMTNLDLDEGTAAREYAYADNRASEVGLVWDAQVIVEDLEAGVDLSWFATGPEFAEIIDGLAGEMAAEFAAQERYEARVLDTAEHAVECPQCKHRFVPGR